MAAAWDRKTSHRKELATPGILVELGVSENAVYYVYPQMANLIGITYKIYDQNGGSRVDLGR